MKELVHLLYPKNCKVCGEELTPDEDQICFACDHEIPMVSLSGKTEALSELFWGRSDVIEVRAYSYYLTGSASERIVHQFKYFGQKRLSKWIARKLSVLVQKQDGFDAIVYIPMHAKKKRERGYNQAELMAKELAKIIEVPVVNLLQRKDHMVSQTKRSRFGRHAATSKLYDVISTNKELDHVLLIDDVITTGSTMEVCANLIIKEYECKVTLMSFAWTPEDPLVLYSNE